MDVCIDIHYEISVFALNSLQLTAIHSESRRTRTRRRRVSLSDSLRDGLASLCPSRVRTVMPNPQRLRSSFRGSPPEIRRSPGPLATVGQARRCTYNPIQSTTTRIARAVRLIYWHLECIGLAGDAVTVKLVAPRRLGLRFYKSMSVCAGSSGGAVDQID